MKKGKKVSLVSKTKYVHSLKWKYFKFKFSIQRYEIYKGFTNIVIPLQVKILKA